MSDESILSETTKLMLREMSQKDRATLRDWFASNNHFTELVEYVDSLDGKPSDV